LTAIAGTAVQAGDPALARRALAEAVSRNPNDANTQLDLGLLLAAIAPGEAAVHLSAAAGEPAFAGLALPVAEALARGPEAAGWALFARQQWSYAELAFLQAAGGPGLSPVAQAALALSRDYQGKDGRAWMDRAVLQAPGEAQVRAIQAIHLRLSGNLEASLTAQQRATSLAPDSPAMLAGLGAAYQRLGQLEEARVWFERAQALAGDDLRIQAMLNSAAQSEAAALDALLDDLAASTAPGAP
jgi:Flp pilus assembly protein TadD